MAEKKADAPRVALFDRIFKPELVSLDNGHTVLRTRSRVPMYVGAVLLAMYISLLVTGFNFSLIVQRAHQLTVILSQIFQPDWSFFPKVVRPLVETIRMSILGSLLGSFLALPCAIIASNNIVKSPVLVGIMRFLLGLVRTLPTLIIANVCALIFSLGPFAGVVAITIFTFGIVAKMLFESIETIDMGPFEAMEALGCNKFQAFWSACMPQILPTYLSHCLYSFELNVRAAAILGYVGAGGLGITINERVGWRDYYGLGTVLVTLFVAVLLIDALSGYLRSKLS